MKVLMMAALFAAGLSGCSWTEPKTPAADERTAKEKRATAARLKRACGSAETYDRLKAFAFDEAAKIRRGGSPMLDSIATGVTVRMENPVAKSRDEELDVTVCEGHLVFDLPPGLQDAFDGDTRLEADVEYAAQAAVDGSGLVYQMQGAEPIIYRLAALGLRDGAVQPSVATARAVPPAVTSPEQAPPVIAAAPPPPVAAAPRPPVQQPRPAAPPPRAEVAAQPDRPATVARPAFNCRVARARVEQMICSDSRLASRDRRMSSAFYAALASGDGETRAALRGSRDRWLAFRNRCPTAACVAQAYDDRMSEIADIAGY
jgi:uncharacterized protein YecT (DUF1311 family)